MSKSVIIDNLVNDQLYGFRIFPRNLKGQYQTELDGATATATPKAIDPVFGNNSWEVINLASTTNTIPSTWHVGDTKDITLTTGETLTMQIYGFKHDDLADGSGKAGITLGMKNLMANTDTANKEKEIFNYMDSAVKLYIKQVNKISYGYGTTPMAVKSEIFYLSETECMGTYSNSKGKEGEKYPIFTDNNSRVKRMNNGIGNAYNWHTRSKKNYDDGQGYWRACYITSSGTSATIKDEYPEGICFGFCI